MKKISLGLVTIVCAMLVVLTVFSGCARCSSEYTGDDITQGKYVCGQASITIKAGYKIFCDNIDFSEVQKGFDEQNIEIDLNECAKSDIAYEVSESDPTHMYLLVTEVLVLNMIYDFQNSTVEFLGDLYILEK